MNTTLQQETLDRWPSEHDGIFYRLVRVCAFNHHDQEDLFQELIRVLIYGWRGSEMKLAAALLYAVFLFLCIKISERITHAPRLPNLGMLREELTNVKHPR